MTPHQLKTRTQTQLRDARNAMLTLEYLVALEQLTDEEKQQAALNLSHTQLAYLRLRKTLLADIRQKLTQNHDDLKAGIASVSEALENLSKVRQIIDAQAYFINLVARIIPLI